MFHACSIALGFSGIDMSRRVPEVVKVYWWDIILGLRCTKRYEGE
jgi:hypothetical protein